MQPSAWPHRVNGWVKTLVGLYSMICIGTAILALYFLLYAAYRPQFRDEQARMFFVRSGIFCVIAMCIALGCTFREHYQAQTEETLVLLDWRCHMLIHRQMDTFVGLLCNLLGAVAKSAGGEYTFGDYIYRAYQLDDGAEQVEKLAYIHWETTEDQPDEEVGQIVIVAEDVAAYALLLETLEQCFGLQEGWTQLRLVRPDQPVSSSKVGAASFALPPTP